MPRRNSSDAPRLFDAVALCDGVLVPLPRRGIACWGALLVGKEKEGLSERSDGGDQGEGYGGSDSRERIQGTS